MSLKSTLTNLGNSIQNKASDAFNSLKSKFKGFFNEASAVFSGLFSGDVTGINANRVPEMQEAIQAYVTDIQNAIDEVVNQSSPDQAFADESMREAIKDFNQAVADVCKNYTSHLLKLYDILGQVRNVYTQNQEAMSSNLRQEAQSTRESVEAYTIGSNSGN